MKSIPNEYKNGRESLIRDLNSHGSDQQAILEELLAELRRVSYQRNTLIDACNHALAALQCLYNENQKGGIRELEICRVHINKAFVHNEPNKKDTSEVE